MDDLKKLLEYWEEYKKWFYYENRTWVHTKKRPSFEGFMNWLSDKIKSEE